jgi:hypothetical protein
MNSNEFLREILNIFEKFDSQTRIHFIKELSKSLNYRECKTIHNIISDRKRKICKDEIRGIPPSIHSPTKIFSIDIEKIQIFKSNAQVAASVSVVDESFKEIYFTLIHYEPPEIANTIENITGFNILSLVNGKDISEVKSDLIKILEKGLVLGFSLENDLKSLDLDINLFENTLDLQSYFRKTSKINPTKTESINLRSLVYHFYKTDIQEGIHSPKTDATYVLKLYFDHYLSNKNLNITPDFEDIERLPKLDFIAHRRAYFANKSGKTFKKI